MEMGRSISNLSRWLKLRLAAGMRDMSVVLHTLAVAAGTLLVAAILLLRISSQRLADEMHSLTQSVQMANQLEVALGSRTQSHIGDPVGLYARVVSFAKLAIERCLTELPVRATFSAARE